MKKEDIIINTIVFKKDLDQGVQQLDLLEKVKDLGLERVEIRREFLQDKQDLKAIKARADELGLSLFYSVNEDFLLADGVNPLVQEVCQEAEILNAPFVKLNIGDASQISPQELGSWYQSQDLSVGIRLENNQTPLHASLANCRLMMDKVKEAGLPISFVFDTGNWAFLGEDNFEAAGLLGTETSYLHCKNYGKGQDGLEVRGLFAGDLDFSSLFPLFSQIDYLALEYPSSMQNLQEDIEKILKIIG